MLHEIGVEIGAKLRAANCPFVIVDGPEATQPTTYARERIVIEHGDNDSFSPVRSQRPNPQFRAVRNVSAKMTIYAQSPSANATDWEHRRRAEHVLDLVLVALDDVCIARKNAWSATGGKFVVPADLSKTEVFGGAAYELSFTVERGVYRQKWDGSIRPTVTNIPITSETQVTLEHGPVDQVPESVR